MGHSRYYPDRAGAVSALSHHLEQQYAARYQVQQLAIDGQDRALGCVVQVRDQYHTTLARIAATYSGLDTAATVAMRPVGEDLEVKVGGAKWIDKAALAGVGLLARTLIRGVGLLVLPAAFGVWRQHRLIEDMVYAIDEFFRQKEPRSCTGSEQQL